LANNPVSIFQKGSWAYLGGLILPLIIGILGPAILSLLRPVILIFIWVFPLIVYIRILNNRIEHKEDFAGGFLRYVTLMPGGTVYNADLAKTDIPFVTISLIAINTVLFFALPEEITVKYLFYPVGDPSLTQVAVAFFANAFLHADFSHLFGNMFFLWIFGSVVEGRVGFQRYILLYFFFIAASNFLTIFFLIGSSLWNSENFWQLFTDSHGLGASGAISGVMGLFAIRCYFSSVTIAIPFLLMPFISFPLRMQGVVLVGLFFALDIKGSLYGLEDSGIDYWAHVGGYLAGIYAAWRLGMHKEAEGEAQKYRAGNLSREYLGRQEATESYLEVLKREPGDIQTLEHLLAVSSYNDEKSGYYYNLLMEEFFKHDLSRAIGLFRGHYPSHMKVLSSKTLLKLGRYFFEKNEQVKAMTCLEFASLESGPWQAKALTLLADSYVAIDNRAMACKTWEDLIEKFPETLFAEEAERKCIKLCG